MDDDAPICPWCGVTALPEGGGFICDNDDCPNVGQPVTEGAIPDEDWTGEDDD